MAGDIGDAAAAARADLTLCAYDCRRAEGFVCCRAGNEWHGSDSAARRRASRFGAPVTLLVAALASSSTSAGIVRGPFSMGGQGARDSHGGTVDVSQRDGSDGPSRGVAS